MKSKFKNINSKLNEINYYPKKEELGAIIIEIFHKNFKFNSLSQKERRQLTFLNESGILIKRTEGNKVDYSLSFYTNIILIYAITKKRFSLEELAAKLNDSVENLSYYLLMFNDMKVLPGVIDYYNEEFVLIDDTLL